MVSLGGAALDEEASLATLAAARALLSKKFAICGRWVVSPTVEATANIFVRHTVQNASARSMSCRVIGSEFTCCG